jgi:protein-L-isoaspartate(D-aspartate) O-methyltransferase
VLDPATSAAARGALVLALRQSGLRDVDVLRAIETVPREIFVPYRLRDLAAKNCPLPIACGQTMASPGVVAVMLQALELHPSHRVIEIGAGSGYATAVLSRLAREVVSFERYSALCVEARARLEQMNVVNATIYCADGLAEPERYGRFERAIVHACLAEPPARLLGALAPGGRLVCALPAESGQGEELVAISAAGDVRRLGPARLGAAAGGVSRAL